MLYVANGNVYAVDADGSVHPVTVTAKDKVIEHRELESVEFKTAKEVVELPAGAQAATEDAVIARFNLSESNPVKFDKKAHSAALGSSEEGK